VTVSDHPRLAPAPPTAPADSSAGQPVVDRSRPHARGRRSWSAWLVLLLVVGGASYGGYRLVEQRIAGESVLDLDRVLLVADPVPVGSPDAAVVGSVDVAAGDEVAAGETLAVIQLAIGGGARQTITVTAPLDATVVRVDAMPGSVVRAGEAIVTLYDPGTLTFRTELPVEQVEKLQSGMSATISGPGLAEPVDAVVDRVLPVIGDAGPDTTTMTVVLVPADDESVAQLVPGVPLTGSLDTSSGTGGSVLDAGA
jgi:biotin carboxyl carrier protein